MPQRTTALSIAFRRRSEPSCECLWIRQDWLDNLKLEVPTTIEELEGSCAPFTEDDPDGNGQKDTYGLGGDELPIPVPSSRGFTATIIPITTAGQWMPTAT